MFIKIINLVFLTASYGLIILFGVKVVNSAIHTYRKSKRMNQRMTDTLSALSKKRNINTLKISTAKHENGNLKRSFKYEGYHFDVSSTATGDIQSCTVYDKEYWKPVIHFVYETENQTFLEKRISDSILKEKKDIKKIEKFMAFIMNQTWFPPTEEKEEASSDKDFALEKGVIRNINPLSTYASKNAQPEAELTELGRIKENLSASDIPLKGEFLHLIDTCFLLSEQVGTFDAQTQHYFHNIVERDIAKAYHAYLQLLDGKNPELHEQVKKSLQMMQSVLDDISESIHNQETFDIKKTLRIIQEKYSN